MIDTFIMVDWSGGNDRGLRPCKDAIWIGVTRDGNDTEPLYMRNRQTAMQALSRLIEAELVANRRAIIGFDFPFGYPKGFAKALTGSSNPFAVWRWLAGHLHDSPYENNRFDLGAQINRHFLGEGPFWFNALKRDIPDLPRKKPNPIFPERRQIETLTPGSFTCWQLGGAGSVGSQTLTGLPVLHQLRDRFADCIAVWPFEPLNKPILFVEIWPGLIERAVKHATGIRDAAQVRLLARALCNLPKDTLDAMLDISAPEEGWILGVGFEDALNAAALAG